MGGGVLIEEVTHQQRLAGDQAVVIEISGESSRCTGKNKPYSERQERAWEFVAV